MLTTLHIYVGGVPAKVSWKYRFPTDDIRSVVMRRESYRMSAMDLTRLTEAVSAVCIVMKE